jgi:hypothetical protein
LHRWNYPWHEFTIGALGNILLFLSGLVVSLLIPSKATDGTRHTLWVWLATERQCRKTQMHMEKLNESSSQSPVSK